MWRERNIFLRLNNVTICSVTPQSCNVILFSFFSFLLFRLIYFKCCFNKWVLLLLLHYSTQYSLLWETVWISRENSFISSLNIEQNKRLTWATCNHIYQISLLQKGPGCTSSRNTSITSKEWKISSGSPYSPNGLLKGYCTQTLASFCSVFHKNTRNSLVFIMNFMKKFTMNFSSVFFLCDTHKKNTELKFMINFGQ